MKAVILGLVFVCLIFSPGPASAEELSATAIYEKTLRSSCWVRAGRSYGTGSVVDKARKWVVTSCRVVGTANDANIWFPVYDKGKVVVDRGQFEKMGKPIRSKVIAREVIRDLALIQMES